MNSRGKNSRGKSLTRNLLTFGAVATGLWSFAPAARAVVVAGTTADYGTYNTSPTTAFPTFNYVGSVNGSSGVYLGNGYAITASHVGPGTLTLTNPNGTTSNYLQDTSVATVRLTNTSDGSGTDLFVFKLATTPALANLSIASTHVSTVTSFYLAGDGVDRAAAVTGGYTLGTTQALRFGQSTVDAIGTFSTVDGGGNVFGTQQGFGTLFTSVSGSAQAVSHDSGGGVFSTTLTNGANTLQGIILGMNTVTNQPANTAYYGDQTYSADLSYYLTQIDDITGLPEPTALGLIGLGGTALLRRRR